MSNKGLSANNRRINSAGEPYLIDIDRNGSAQNNFQEFLGNPSSSNHYKVSMNLAKAGPGSTDQLSQWLTSAGIFGKHEPKRYDFLCAETVLPGKSVETFTELGSRQGIEEFFPVRNVYADLSMTFYVSSDYKVLRLFQEWLHFMQPMHSANAGKVTAPSASGYASMRDGNNFQRHRYPSEYKRELHVTKFERDYKTKMTYGFINAFPVNINSIALSYDEGTVTKVTVDFKYDKYVIINLGIEEDSKPVQHEKVSTASDGSTIASVSSNFMDGRAPWDASTPSPFTLGNNLNFASDFRSLADFNSPLLQYPT
jgi:hypothetical protein